MDNDTICKIETTDKPFILHIEASAATLITFELNFQDLDYAACVADICKVLPHMMSLDSDLMEAYDDAFRTRPKQENIKEVKAFLIKYRNAIEDADRLAAEFDLRFS